MNETISPDLKPWAGPVPAPSVEYLADHHAVTQLAKIYALGVDMHDLELLNSAFAADAFIDGSAGAMPADEYLKKIYDGTGGYASTQHNITNQYVTLSGDDAVVWSYAVAYHWAGPDTPSDRGDLRVGVQYRDKCRRSPQGWVIVSRQVVRLWTDGVDPRKAR